MKTTLKATLAALCFSGLAVGVTQAGSIAITTDRFGSGENVFNIDFAHIGNPGNGNHPGPEGGVDSPPRGSVAYEFRIATFETSQEVIDKATASGMSPVESGPWTGIQPTATIKWFDGAKFVNWLNTSTGRQAAYNLTADVNGKVTGMNLWSSGEAWQAGGENLYRHKDAYYFLPSEDEWCKAAYHKNDGPTANYWAYAVGSNEVPNGKNFPGDPVYDAVFVQDFTPTFDDLIPSAATMVGGANPYGTFGQNGCMWEWFESAFDGSNDSATENRGYRGGDVDSSWIFLRADIRVPAAPMGAYEHLGFRVASVVPFLAAPSPYRAWVSKPEHGLTSGTNDGPLDDPELDGVGNLLEFTLGGAPLTPSRSVLPTLTFSGGKWVFAYERSAASRSSIAHLVEYGTDQVNWTAIPVIAGRSASVTITPGSLKDQVIVTIPASGAKQFVRLKVTQ